jgi:hypothetical protein
MPTDPPIACTLSAAELPERFARMRAVGKASLLTAEATASRAILRFAPGAGTRGRLEAIVAAEAECCAFLELGLAQDSESLVLTIDAPEGAEAVMLGIVGAVSGDVGVRA